ncbi:MAG: alpha-galactosidase [Bacteroidia bacterium]|nr:alpha-galactosidase [Bacteroidia bacterium]
MVFRKGILTYTVKGRKIEYPFNLDGKNRHDSIEIVQEIQKLSNGLILSVWVVPSEEVFLHDIQLESNLFLSLRDKIFLNGYQSWSESLEYSIEDRIPPIRSWAKPVLKSYSDAFFFDYPNESGELHGYSYAFYYNDLEKYQFIGSLAESTGFTRFLFEARKNRLLAQKDCNFSCKRRFLAFKLLLVSGKEQEVFSQYFQQLGLKCVSPKVAGWTSWYYHYTNISEKLILQELDSVKQVGLPFQYFQIDDGWQPAVGDWLAANRKFPSGMAELAQKIREKGFIPGLWLAPFICERKSELFRKHPDWLLKSKKKRIPAGFNPIWGGWFNGTFYALDLQQEQVRDYIASAIRQAVNEWGYGLLKLDFLYAAALYPPPNKTRGQVMHEAMTWLRSVAESCNSKPILLGCGVPLSAAFGNVEYCRIGNDVSLSWEDNFLHWLQYRERVSTIASLHCTIHRRQLDKFAFRNDPDVFILRKEKNQLSHEQRLSLFLWNQLCGGLLFTSDDFSKYGEEEITWLKRMFPLREIQILKITKPDFPGYQAEFLIDQYKYRMIANFTAKNRQVSLPTGLHYNHRTGQIEKGSVPFTLKPWQTVCLHEIRQTDKNQPTIAGSLGHIFPLAEITTCKIREDKIELQFHQQATPAEVMFLAPLHANQVEINGVNCNVREEDGIRLLRFQPQSVSS